jgi:hypothetical protein
MSAGRARLRAEALTVISSAPGVAVGPLNSAKIGGLPAAVMMAAFMLSSPLWFAHATVVQYRTLLDII